MECRKAGKVCLKFEPYIYYTVLHGAAVAIVSSKTKANFPNVHTLYFSFICLKLLTITVQHCSMQCWIERKSPANYLGLYQPTFPQCLITDRVII